MQSLSQHWPWRLFWLVLGVGTGGWLIADSARSHLLGQLLAGTGLVAFGVVWFFHPTRLNAPPRASFESALRMHPAMRLFAAMAALLLIAGAVLRFVFNL